MAALVILVGMAWGRPGIKTAMTIADVSWPNCGARPARHFASGVVGVNGGLDFHPNPCLAEEAAWFDHYEVYLNTGYPGDGRGRKFAAAPRACAARASRCLAYNYGFNAALYSIRYANLQNVHPTMWWLDVETVNSWSDDFLVNRQFINGAVAALRQTVWPATVGIYSSSEQWRDIVGPWQNRLPAWLATGALHRSEAVGACHNKSFTGGHIWLSQYTNGLDENVACSADWPRSLANQPPKTNGFAKPLSAPKL